MKPVLIVLILFIIFFLLTLAFAFYHETILHADNKKAKIALVLTYVFMILTILSYIMCIFQAIIEVPPEQAEVYLRCY